MSENRPPREWHFYVEDMIEFAEKAQAYTEGLTQEQFVADGLTYDATLRNLELIGEAATRIPEDVRTHFNRVPWRQVIGTRNRLIHAYLGIDDDVVWSIIQDDLSNLIVNLYYIADNAGGF